MKRQQDTREQIVSRLEGHGADMLIVELSFQYRIVRNTINATSFSSALANSLLSFAFCCLSSRSRLVSESSRLPSFDLQR